MAEYVNPANSSYSHRKRSKSKDSSKVTTSPDGRCIVQSLPSRTN